MTAAKLLIAVFSIFMLAGVGYALKCHQCTSFEHAKCNDPFVYEPARAGDVRKPKTNEFLKDCPNDGNNYTICRKIYQYVRGDERIIRSCGYEEYKNECYKTVLEEYNTYVCQCSEDGCNGASGVKVSFAAAILALVTSFILAK